MKWIFGLLGLLLLTGCIQSGSSTDTIYGFDRGPVWNHMYLKNDHSTTYCFEDHLLDEVETAYKSGASVKVTYQKYIIKGALCTPQENTEAVVLTDIQ